jgi:hypothetical protein
MYDMPVYNVSEKIAITPVDTMGSSGLCGWCLGFCLFCWFLVLFKKGVCGWVGGACTPVFLGFVDSVLFEACFVTRFARLS